MKLPARSGELFSPARFPFLEGWPGSSAPQIHESVDVPLIPDGTIYRVLGKLLVLDGERISYRALDVEQIGSVYETMMGFRLETATGRSVADQGAEEGSGRRRRLIWSGNWQRCAPAAAGEVGAATGRIVS